MASSTDWRIIINGRRADTPGLDEAVEALRAQGRVVDICMTEEAGDAARFTRQAVDDGVACVIAGGGDGTLGTVAGAMAGSGGDELPALALLPLGTANDFARAAGLPTGVDEALELVASVEPVPIDVLRVTAGETVRWCINVATGGFGTEATTEAPDLLKRTLGGLAYVIEGLARLPSLEGIPVRLDGPGLDWDEPVTLIAAGNGRLAGGGNTLCPDALVDDGLVDLTVVPDLEGQVATTIATILTEGQVATLEQVAGRVRLPWFELRAPEPFTFNLDGEPLTARHVRIECVPGRLRMHLPLGCPLLKPAVTPI